jgi:steroid 5-alpha reductase family enzyme
MVTQNLRGFGQAPLAVQTNGIGASLGMMVTMLLDLFLSNLIAIAAMMLVAWLVSLAARKTDVVDSFWGPGFAVVAWTTLALASTRDLRACLLTACVTLWALRLSAHITWRNRGRPEDWRYVKIRGETNNWMLLSLVKVFAVQGVLLFIISLPLQLGLRGSPMPLGPLDGVGLLLWLVGFGCEAIADWQLTRFKANPAHRGKALDTGLWRYSRHPNYFGDTCLWWGYFLLALAGGAPVWTIVGPLLMTFLLLKVSGVAMLESGLKERNPAYAGYIARTSAFIPWPPKKVEEPYG